MPVMRALLAFALVCGIALGLVAGCGDDTRVVTDTGANGQVTTRTVPKIHFAKTKFVLHSGLAFGAFHRYIYKPYKAGTFRSGAPGRKRAIVKAAAAGLFSYHELKVARRDVLASDTLRRHLLPLIDKLTSKISLLTAALKGGSLNPAQIIAAEGAAAALKGRAAGDGANIQDRSAPIPGT